MKGHTQTREEAVTQFNIRQATPYTEILRVAQSAMPVPDRKERENGK